MNKLDLVKSKFNINLILFIVPGALIIILLLLMFKAPLSAALKNISTKKDAPALAQGTGAKTELGQPQLKDLVGVSPDGVGYAYFVNTQNEGRKLVLWDTSANKIIGEMAQGLDKIDQIDECIVDVDNKKLACQSGEDLYVVDFKSGEITDILEKYSLKVEDAEVLCYVGFFDYSEDNLYFSLHCLNKRNMTKPTNKLYHVYWDNCGEVNLKINDNNTYLRPLKIVDDKYVYVMRMMNERKIKNDMMSYYLYKVGLDGKVLSKKSSKMPVFNYGMASLDGTKIIYSYSNTPTDLNVYDFKTGESVTLCKGDNADGFCRKRFWLDGNRILAIIDEPIGDGKIGEFRTIARTFNFGF